MRAANRNQENISGIVFFTLEFLRKKQGDLSSLCSIEYFTAKRSLFLHSSLCLGLNGMISGSIFDRYFGRNFRRLWFHNPNIKLSLEFIPLSILDIKNRQEIEKFLHSYTFNLSQCFQETIFAELISGTFFLSFSFVINLLY